MWDSHARPIQKIHVLSKNRLQNLFPRSYTLMSLQGVVDLVASCAGKDGGYVSSAAMNDVLAWSCARGSVLTGAVIALPAFPWKTHPRPKTSSLVRIRLRCHSALMVIPLHLPVFDTDRVYQWTGSGIRCRLCYVACAGTQWRSLRVGHKNQTW